MILYGHAESNAAWPALLGESPVQVRRGQVQIGARTVSGDDLACLFVRPRPGSDRASVGVVSGSGLIGLRLTERLPYFTSGVAYPDCVLLERQEPEPRAQGHRSPPAISGRTGMSSQASLPGATERPVTECVNPR